MTTVTLPPLPKPTQGLGGHHWSYSAEDMINFAKAAISKAALDAPQAVPTSAMIAAGVAAMYAGAWESDAAEVEAVLKAALDAPQAVDCRGCAHYSLCKVPGKIIAKDCTNGDKFQALPKIMLYLVPK